MAFLTGWTYRKAITLSRASGAVTNYQMKLLVGESSGAAGEDVDCAAHVKTDFSDLRFTTADGTTLLDYWIESVSGTTPNQLATVWIEFDSIGTGATTFYMYYGNAGATAASSGANTFVLFDDFERGNNGDAIGGSWTVVTGSVVISTEQAYGGTRSGKLAGGTTPPNATIPLTHSSDLSIYLRFYKKNAAEYRIEGGNGTKAFSIFIDSAESIFYYDTAYRDTTVDATADAWNTFELNNFNFTAGTFDIWHQGSKIKSGAGMYVAGGYYTNVIRNAAGNTAGADTYIENVIARNWRATGPAWGSWGSEEAAIQHYTLTLEPASFSMTGAALRLLNNKKIVASPGAYAMVGKDMGMSKTLVPFSLEPGAFAMTGAALSIRRPVSYMRMNPGSYQINGAPVDIKYSWYDGEAAANYQFRKQRRNF